MTGLFLSGEFVVAQPAQTVTEDCGWLLCITCCTSSLDLSTEMKITLGR